jgi:hypothetical protein
MALSNKAPIFSVAIIVLEVSRPLVHVIVVRIFLHVLLILLLYITNKSKSFEERAKSLRVRVLPAVSSSSIVDRCHSQSVVPLVGETKVVQFFSPPDENEDYSALCVCIFFR